MYLITNIFYFDVKILLNFWKRFKFQNMLN